MVIQKFNKLIRNKWVWGVFAVVVSAAFCFDDMFADRGQDRPDEGGRDVAGVKVDPARFLAISEDVRGFGPQRDWQTPDAEVTRVALENYAMLEVGDRNGLILPVSDVQDMIRMSPYFQQNGAFSFSQYEAALRANDLTPERYEQMCTRQMSLAAFNRVLTSAAVWSSPMEVEQATADMTDTFTIKVARFEQTKKEADAIKMGEADLKKWFDANVKSLEVPERVRIRFVKFDATKKDVQDRMIVTDTELHDRYDVSLDRYTTTDTNGVEQVKTFDEVKGELERELRLIAAVQFFETNVNQRVYGVKAAPKASRLDEIAKEDKLNVQTSDWFATDGSWLEGFMKRPEQILPGAQGFAAAVAELDPSSEDLRYAVVSSANAVWLIEKAETSPKHLPTFAEAKSAILPRALREARAEAFKAAVEAVAKKGAAAVAAVKGVSTNITFCVSELVTSAPAFDDQMAVVRAASRLKKGEVSEFTLTAPGKALLVICEDRVTGEPAAALNVRDSVRYQLAALQGRQLPDAWRKWNLRRFGYVAEVAEEDLTETEVTK